MALRLVITELVLAVLAVTRTAPGVPPSDWLVRKIRLFGSHRRVRDRHGAGRKRRRAHLAVGARLDREAKACRADLELGVGDGSAAAVQRRRSRSRRRGGDEELDDAAGSGRASRAADARVELDVAADATRCRASAAGTAVHRVVAAVRASRAGPDAARPGIDRDRRAAG